MNHLTLFLHLYLGTGFVVTCLYNYFGGKKRGYVRAVQPQSFDMSFNPINEIGYLLIWPARICDSLGQRSVAGMHKFEAADKLMIPKEMLK